MKFRVHGVENDNTKLELLKETKLYFYEPLLKDRLKIEKKNKYFSFSNSFFISKTKINIFFLCVGTPDKKNGQADISYIENIIKNLKKKLLTKKFCLLLNLQSLRVLLIY
jgi:UDPglucose 6-dehydrogenase